MEQATYAIPLAVFGGEIVSRDARDGRRVVYIRFDAESGPMTPIGISVADARRLSDLLAAAADGEQLIRLNSGIDQFEENSP